ncbi:MAG: tyrosine-type recombinase/integrase [Thermoanaerobaculia bacterium]
MSDPVLPNPTNTASNSFDREIALFIQERKRLGYSSGYLDHNIKSIRSLRESLVSRGRPVDLLAVTEGDILASLSSEQSRGLADNTIRVAAVGLRVFFAWLYKKGLILIDPARHIALGHKKRTLGYVPTPADVKKLLAACDVETDHGLRNRAILELLYGSGLRLNEVKNLDTRDIDLAERSVFIKNAKGRKDRIVPLTETAADMIGQYLKHVRPPWPHAALFVSIAGGRFEPHNWRSRQLRPLVMDVGLPITLTPHRLRHACAVHLLQNGADIRHIQKLLGHASISTTEIYLALDVASLQKTIENAHPREHESPLARSREDSDDDE